MGNFRALRDTLMYGEACVHVTLRTHAKDRAPIGSEGTHDVSSLEHSLAIEHQIRMRDVIAIPSLLLHLATRDGPIEAIQVEKKTLSIASKGSISRRDV